MQLSDCGYQDNQTQSNSFATVRASFSLTCTISIHHDATLIIVRHVNWSSSVASLVLELLPPQPACWIRQLTGSVQDPIKSTATTSQGVKTGSPTGTSP
jgi:hypothetical protein